MWCLQSCAALLRGGVGQRRLGWCRVCAWQRCPRGLRVPLLLVPARIRTPAEGRKDSLSWHSFSEQEFTPSGCTGVAEGASGANGCMDLGHAAL